METYTGSDSFNQAAVVPPSIPLPPPNSKPGHCCPASPTVTMGLPCCAALRDAVWATAAALVFPLGGLGPLDVRRSELVPVAVSEKPVTTASLAIPAPLSSPTTSLPSPCPSPATHSAAVLPAGPSTGARV
ncbi:hypothetical protein E2C01_039800 [Portunus trituberculatus]|uniref:Uncharacterized protein n=1 Tax=Portunus trituberculatus TaxID=210409 RepID=A0A5B7FFP6_PORTR|nr:hypothetical protein [Portunus trituberculatus]